MAAQTSFVVVELPQALAVVVGHGGAVAGGKLEVPDAALLVNEAELATTELLKILVTGTIMVDVVPLLTMREVELNTDVTREDCAVEMGIVDVTPLLTLNEVDVTGDDEAELLLDPAELTLTLTEVETLGEALETEMLSDTEVETAGREVEELDCTETDVEVTELPYAGGTSCEVEALATLTEVDPLTVLLG